MIFAGIDAGSRTIKICLLDANTSRVAAMGVVDQGASPGVLAERLLGKLLEQHGLTHDQVARAVATGYARQLVGFAHETRSEITCHALGVHHLLPEARSIIEIGGQDSKVVHLDKSGGVQDFAMNDRCAAGTGRFLETVAARLNVTLDGLGEMASRSRAPAAISSTCVVFAETEVIGLLSCGVAPEDIVAGVEDAVARRVATLTAGRLTQPLVLTGGVALVPGMRARLAAALGQPVMVAPNPQFTGALGAALLASAPAGAHRPGR